MVTINLHYLERREYISFNIENYVVLKDIKKICKNIILNNFQLYFIQYDLYEKNKNNEYLNLRKNEKKINEYETLSILNFHILKHDSCLFTELMLRCDDNICFMCNTLLSSDSLIIVCSECSESLRSELPNYQCLENQLEISELILE